MRKNLNRCRHDTIRDILKYLISNNGATKSLIFSGLNINGGEGNRYLAMLYRSELLVPVRGEFSDWGTVYDITPDGVLWLNLYSQIEGIL